MEKGKIATNTNRVTTLPVIFRFTRILISWRIYSIPCLFLEVWIWIIKRSREERDWNWSLKNRASIWDQTSCVRACLGSLKDWKEKRQWRCLCPIRELNPLILEFHSPTLLILFKICAFAESKDHLPKLLPKLEDQAFQLILLSTLPSLNREQIQGKKAQSVGRVRAQEGTKMEREEVQSGRILSPPHQSNDQSWGDPQVWLSSTILRSQAGWARTLVWTRTSCSLWRSSPLNIWVGLRFSWTRWRRSAKCKSDRWKSRGMWRKSSSRRVEWIREWSRTMDFLRSGHSDWRTTISTRSYVGLLWATIRERGSGYKTMESFIYCLGLGTKKRSQLRRQN